MKLPFSIPITVPMSFPIHPNLISNPIPRKKKYVKTKINIDSISKETTEKKKKPKKLFLNPLKTWPALKSISMSCVNMTQELMINEMSLIQYGSSLKKTDVNFWGSSLILNGHLINSKKKLSKFFKPEFLDLTSQDTEEQKLIALANQIHNQECKLTSSCNSLNDLNKRNEEAKEFRDKQNEERLKKSIEDAKENKREREKTEEFREFMMKRMVSDDEDQRLRREEAKARSDTLRVVMTGSSCSSSCSSSSSTSPTSNANFESGASKAYRSTERRTSYFGGIYAGETSVV